MRQGASRHAPEAVAERGGRRRRVQTGGSLNVTPVGPFPSRLAVGRGQAFFVDGTCSHPTRRIRALEIRLADRRQPVIGFGMARPASVIDDDYWRGIVTAAPVDEPRT